MKQLVRNFFILVFLVGSFYILMIETRLYHSGSITMVKNLSDSAPDLGGLGIFAPAASSTVKDARILQAYLSSEDELQRLDKLFRLNEHYHSDALDPWDRLWDYASREDFYRKYLSRLQLDLDEVSGLLTIGFLHTDANTSRAIVEQLIADSDAKINEYNRLVAKKRLSYLVKQVARSKEELDHSIEQLKKFQSGHSLLDPGSSAQTRSAIIANLESTLVRKEAELNEMQSFMSEKNLEVVRLKREIVEIKKALKKIRKGLAGKGNESLNTVLFEFEYLKGIVEMNRELYKAAVLQYEQTKAEISKNPKVLMKLTQPNLPDEYSYPQKAKSIFMLFLMLSLGYGIFALIHNIVKEH